MRELVYSPYRFSTWRLTAPDGEVRFVKIGSIDAYPSIRAERDRMVWLAGRLPVPRVLDHGRSDDVEWLLTSRLAGRDATHAELISDPATTVPLLAQGLRALHAVPADDCPFDFRLDAALDHARRRVEATLVSPLEDLHPEHAGMSPGRALERLERERPVSEDVVLCHGDYCFPNVLIEDQRVVGYLDLGEVGVADRWWDLAVATWSTTWNVGPGWEELFLESYGIQPDQERMAYYRLLYDLAS